jgi:hypothetical protein
VVYIQFFSLLDTLKPFLIIINNNINKEARLKIVFSSVVYILFFSLLDPLKPFLIIIIN